jgi:hypothetical protein
MTHVEAKYEYSGYFMRVGDIYGNFDSMDCLNVAQGLLAFHDLKECWVSVEGIG